MTASDELTLSGLTSIEHTFEVPLDHRRPNGPVIEVFARELAEPDGRERPFLVYFQGGPGFEATRPTLIPRGPAWIERALTEFRVLLLDQRGTGRSTPVGALDGLSPDEQADYLAHFRADSIVRDAEWIRRALGVDRWSVLGQSFGGFCVVAYLSSAPEGLAQALICGGLPPLRRSIDEVYPHTYARTLERNQRYRQRYPSDGHRLQRIKQRIEGEGICLPTGVQLTWRRFRQVGAALGMSDGADRVHHLLELDPDSPAFAHDVPDEFSRNPIYAILHESCYCDGGATNWAADRLLPTEYEDSTLLTGEHIYPWMFEDYAGLRPLRAAAQRLAARTWPAAYDPDVLAANEVPAAAIIYAEDMYVERIFSEETAARIRGLRPWLTNEYDHNGLRADGGRILGRLLDLAGGRL